MKNGGQKQVLRYNLVVSVLVVAYQWWLCQVDVHMAEMYG